MKKCMAGILLFVLVSGIAAGEADLTPLWEQYAKIEFDDFYCSNIEMDGPNPLKGAILYEIQEYAPNDWMVNLELSDLEFDMSVHSAGNDAAEVHQENSEQYMQKALKQFQNLAIDSIETSYTAEMAKGLAYFNFGLLSGDSDISKEAYLRSYRSLCGTYGENMPLFKMMYALFGTEYIMKAVWGREEDFYSDETAAFVCEQVLEKFEPFLESDLQKYVKMQMYQMLIEANTYLAYSAYFCNDWEEMNRRIEKSADLLSKRSAYGDVSGGVDPEGNRVPVCEMYDAHMRALYHKSIGDEAHLAQDLRDYSSAYECAREMRPVEFEPILFKEMNESISALEDR